MSRIRRPMDSAGGTTMATLTTSDGVELFVTEAGSGAPLVILPGWGVSHRWFKEQCAAGMTSRFRVICYAPRGQGDSERTERGQRMGRMAADLAEVIASVGEPVHVLAWSGGGSTVLQYVELFGTGSLRSLVLVGAGPRLMKEPDWELGFLELADAKNWVDLIRDDVNVAMRSLAPQFFAGDPAGRTRGVGDRGHGPVSSGWGFACLLGFPQCRLPGRAGPDRRADPRRFRRSGRVRARRECALPARAHLRLAPGGDRGRSALPLPRAAARVQRCGDRFPRERRGAR